MSDTTNPNPTKKTTEEKIRIAIAFLQRQGYQVVSRHSIRHNKFVSNDIERRMKAEREAQISTIQTAAMLGTAEVAAIIGVHQQTILSWTKAGNFPAPINISGRHRWNAETITQYMKEHGISFQSSNS